MGTMHAGTMSSERLQHTRNVLLDGKWHSTWEIAGQTKSCAVHSDIAALRVAVSGQNETVEHKREGRIHFYRLVALG